MFFAVAYCVMLPVSSEIRQAIYLSPLNTYSGRCNSFYCLGHFKNVYDDDDDDDLPLPKGTIVDVCSPDITLIQT